MRPLTLAIITGSLLLSCGDDPGTGATPEIGDQVPAETVNRPEQIEIVVAIGRVEPEEEISYLAAASGGMVAKVYKNDGEQVREGELLVQLEDDTEQLQIAQVRSQITSQQTQIELDQNAIRETQTRLASLQKKLATTGKLVESGAETAQEFTDLQTEIQLLEVALEKDRLTVQLARNKLEELRRELILYETQATRKRLKAPANGTVLDLLVQPGNALNQYANYAEFAREGQVVVRAEIDELFADRVEQGQPVEIRFIGNTSTIARGKVAKLAPYLKRKSLFAQTPEEREDRLVREIEITLEELPSLLLNTKVECVIRTGS